MKHGDLIASCNVVVAASCHICSHEPPFVITWLLGKKKTIRMILKVTLSPLCKYGAANMLVTYLYSLVAKESSVFA